MSSSSGVRENPYDMVPTDGDPYERDDSPRPLKRGDCVISSEPLKDTVDDIGGGEGVILHPGDTYSTPMGPDQLQRWYAIASAGNVLEAYVERVPNTGGHHHGGRDRGVAASGHVTPSRIVFQRLQAVLCPYSSPVACGRIFYCATFRGHPPINIFYDVRVPGLVEIKSSISLKLKTTTIDHPSPYWATAGFATKLQMLADQYHKATGARITVTDASLEWGGRFDLKS